MSSRRLRIVTPRYGADIVGGTEGLVRRLARALAERDWHVEIWTTTAADEATWTSGYDAGLSDDEGVEVRRFAVRRQRNPSQFAQLSRVFFRLPERLRPEALWQQLQGPYAPSLIQSLARSETIPTVFTPYLFYTTVAGIAVAPHPRVLMPAAHDELPLSLGGVARAFAACDGLLFHTPEERDLVYQRFPGSVGLPCTVGTVGVDRITPDGSRSGAGGYIYFGGRSIPGKGIEILVEAIALARRQNPEVQLVISGPASDDPMLRSTNGVRAVGTVTDNKRAELFRDAAAVVVPGAMESLSMLALEAWSAGQPCILNANSPVLAGQALRSGGALTFTDAEGLAGAMLKLISDRELATQLGQAGRGYVESGYRWDDVAARIATLLDSVGSTR